MQGILHHLRHHARFYGATALGVMVWLLAAREDAAFRTVLAGNAFFIAYLVSVAILLMRGKGRHFRAQLRWSDEGLVLVSVLTLGAAGLSVGALFALLNQQAQGTPLQTLFCVSSVPLAWLTLHTVYAFHYARLYFSDASGEGAGKGLKFPGGGEPGEWEFLYFAFVVGMTAQVSDVVVTASRLRRLVLVHGIVSFFFNTVILALAVNIVVTMNA